MKKYLILLFLFLFISFPVIAKSANGNQVKNQNQTQNEGVETQLQEQNEEIEQVDEDVRQNINKVSDQVKQLKLDFEDEGGIGAEVKKIAQNQEKNQEKIKSAYYELKNRGQFVRLFVGSDKKKIEALEQMSEENKLLIENLEKLKAETLNQTEKDQLQLTIESMIKQNTSLENELNNEKKVNGLFGWFVKLFNRK